MAFTTIDNPSEYFQTALFTGSTSNVTVDIDMRPDLFWFKSRTQTYSHLVYDTSRPSDGTTMPSGDVNMYNFLITNGGGAEDDNNADGLVQTSTGFIVDGDGQAISEANQGANNMVTWCWKANGGTTSSNTDGSITSTVQTDSTAGFSIISYSGNDTAGATIGHGLGAVPSFAMFKRRDASENWNVYHKDLNIATQGRMVLDTDAAGVDEEVWNDTSPNSTVFTLGDNDRVNNSTGGASPYIAYAWKDVQGYSKSGSYTGNSNADGPFIYTGFKPAFLIWKKTNSADDWGIHDNERNDHAGNAIDDYLRPNENAAEGDDGDSVDFLSNGFKWRLSSGLRNNSGDTYIYMAFAEHPFVSSDGVPTTAR